MSAMTVPTLMQNYQRKSYVTQLHKVYNELQQALLQYQTDRNALNLKEAGLISKANVKIFFEDYIKFVQSCDGVLSPCFSTSYKNINGGNVNTINSWSAGSCVVMSSGSSICMDHPATYNNGSFGYVFIDINGSQGPNILGRDAFYLSIFPDGVLDVKDAGIDCRTKGECGEGKSLTEVRGTVEACKATINYVQHSCFGQILNDNWEMNY